MPPLSCRVMHHSMLKVLGGHLQESFQQAISRMACEVQTKLLQLAHSALLFTAQSAIISNYP